MPRQPILENIEYTTILRKINSTGHSEPKKLKKSMLEYLNEEMSAIDKRYEDLKESKRLSAKLRHLRKMRFISKTGWQYSICYEGIIKYIFENILMKNSYNPTISSNRIIQEMITDYFKKCDNKDTLSTLLNDFVKGVGLAAQWKVIYSPMKNSSLSGIYKFMDLKTKLRLTLALDGWLEEKNIKSLKRDDFKEFTSFLIDCLEYVMTNSENKNTKIIRSFI